MSQSTATHAAGAVPFSQPRADTPGGWIAGLLFGLVCIVAAIAYIVTYAVITLARAVGRPVGRWIRAAQPRVAVAVG